MHAQRVCGAALISSLLAQHNRDENALKFSDRLLVSHAGAVHLEHNVFKLSLHRRSQIHIYMLRVSERIQSAWTVINTGKTPE
jgi:hypothetical protein